MPDFDWDKFLNLPPTPEAQQAKPFNWVDVLGSDVGALVDPDRAKAVHQDERLDQARRQWAPAAMGADKELFGVGVRDIKIPVASALWDRHEAEKVGKAREAYAKTEATDEQLGLIAMDELRQQRRQQATLPQTIARTAAGLPAVLGEAGLAAPVAGAGLARLGMGAGKTLLGQGARTGLTMAAATTGMPSTWLHESQERANQNGGEWWEPKNAAPAFVQAAVTNAVLGQVAKFAGVAGERATSTLGRLGTRAAVGGLAMPVEQQAADAGMQAVSDLLEKAGLDKKFALDTKYGTIGLLLAGKGDEALKSATTQAVLGAGFAAFHGNKARPVETLAKAVDALADAGVPKEQAGQTLAQTIAPVTDALNKGDLDAAKAAAAQLPDGIQKIHAETLIHSQESRVASLTPDEIKALAKQMGLSIAAFKKSPAYDALLKQGVVSKPGEQVTAKEPENRPENAPVDASSTAPEPRSDTQSPDRPVVPGEGDKPVAGPQGDRRINTALRKKVAEMSPEERAQALLRSPVVDLPNRRAFDEAGPAPAVAMSDADGLKAFNDKFGYEAGNALLRAKADALKAAGLDAYHDKGDEFLYRGGPDLAARLDAARQTLRNSLIEVTGSDGRIRWFQGADFSFGVGHDLPTAESGLKSHKSARELAGERARGELRGITEAAQEPSEVGPGRPPQAAPDEAAPKPPGGRPPDPQRAEAGPPQAGPPPVPRTPGRAEAAPNAPVNFGRPLTPEEKARGNVGGGQENAAETQARIRETALANARVDAERAKIGLPPLLDAARRTNPEVWDRAMSELARDPDASLRLVDDLTAKPRATTVDENALLLHRKVALSNEYERTLRSAIEAMQQKRPEQFDLLSARADDLLGQIDKLDHVTRSTGTEWGRAGQFRKQLAAEDFSLTRMVQEATVHKKGPLTPEELAEITALHDRIKALEAELEKVKNEGGRKDRDPTDVEVDINREKKKYRDRIGGYDRSNQSRHRKALEFAKETGNFYRAFKTSYDLSAVLRQGGILTGDMALRRPVKVAQNLAGMVRDMMSEHHYDRNQLDLTKHPDFESAKNAGLYFSDLPGVKGKKEEGYVGGWPLLRKWTGIALSERAYNGYLNRLRMDVYSDFARRDGLTPDEQKALANYVNVATGRGKLPGSLEQAADVTAQLLFSPRFLASRFQLLAGQPFYGGSARTRKLIALSMARSLGSLAVFYGLTKLAAGDDVKFEWDPRSADFGKMRFGNYRVDPLAGLSQEAVFVVRNLLGETKSTSTGKVTDLRGPGWKHGTQSQLDVATNFARNKLAPLPGLAADTLTGQTAGHEPAPTFGTFGRLFRGKASTTDRTALKKETGEVFVPIVGHDIYDALTDQGMGRGSALGLLAILGMGSQLYEPRVRK